MSGLPAVVSILTLGSGTLSSSAVFPASMTVAGVATTLGIPLGSIMSASFGALPTGGGTGQLLSKTSGDSYSTAWSNIAAALVASTGVSIAGSTTATIALATSAPLSVLGVAGAATASPLPIEGTGAQVLRLNDAGTVLGFGAVNLGSSAAVSGVLTVPFGGTGTSTLTAFGVVYGNAAATAGITSAGTTAWSLLGNGSAVAPSFQQVILTASVTGTLSVLFGGIGFSAVATGDILYATTATTLARRAISTATQVLQVMAGATTVNYGAVNLTTAVTGTLTVPFGGLGLATLATGDLLYASNDTTLARLAAVTAGFVLIANGTLAAPGYTTVIGTTTFNINATKAQFALATAIPAGGSTTVGVTLSSVANFGLFVGTGVPGLSAGTGSIYLRSDATTAAQRLYVNINGTGGWTNFTTAAKEMSLTYATYVSSLSNLLVVPSGDAGFQAALPNIIDDAEQRIYRELDLINTSVRGTTALVAGERNFTVPSFSAGAFQVVDMINVITPAGTTNPESGTRNQLVPASEELLNSLWPAVTGSTVPQYVAMFDQTRGILGPWPLAAYTIEVVGTIRPNALSSSNVTTLLSVYFPDLFVAASMVFAAGYQKNFGAAIDDPKAAVTWESHYQTLLPSAKTEEARKKFTGPAWSSKEPAPLVTPPRT